MTERKYCVFRFAGVEVRERELQVLRDGKILTAEPKAFRALLYLLRNSGHVVRKEELLDAVWHDTAVTDNSVDAGNLSATESSRRRSPRSSLH